MLEQLAPPVSAPSPPIRSFQCRVYQRLACDLPGFCQPAAGRGSSEARFAATVRDISQSGVCIQLPRRYEPGTGLAIELAAKGRHEKCTFFAKVIHIKSHSPGLWSLGCQFVSPLSEEELQGVLGSTIEKDSSSVELLLATPQGELVRCRIKRFFLPLPWPPPAGKILVVRGGAGSRSPWSFKARVVYCRERGRRWVLGCHLMEPRTATEVLGMLGTPA
jgi:PilZ domain